MIPPGFAAVWFGPPWLSAFTTVIGAGMGWEWGRLASGRFGPREMAVVATIVASVLAVAIGAGNLAIVIACLGAIATAALTRGARLWAGAGTLWIAGGCLAFLWLSMPAGGGRDAALWVLALVAATDIFAYAVGKLVGGPKLAPRLSPNKTWAGLAGGLIGGGLVGAIAALLEGSPSAGLIATSMLLALTAQVGDLIESLAKRHFGVKDTSDLIPGHGGLLDRLDGLIAASMAAAILTLLEGRSPLFSP